jgi:peroxiredoxin Q/BCP
VGDTDGSIRRAYDVRWPIVGIAKRVTYVIGQDRRILSAFRNERDMTAHTAHACDIVRGVSQGHR